MSFSVQPATGRHHLSEAGADPEGLPKGMLGRCSPLSVPGLGVVSLVRRCWRGNHWLQVGEADVPAIECPADEALSSGFELGDVPILKGGKLPFREEGRSGIARLP